MAEQRWKLEDYTGTDKGYLRLTCDGKRVADFFPFAHGTNPNWVRQRATEILNAMNSAD